MRSMFERTALAISVLAGLTIVACTTESVGPPTVQELAIEAPLDTLVSLGETAQFTATALDASGNVLADVDVTWTSSDPTVAMVDESGLVTALSNGPVTISAAIGPLQSQAALAVAQQVASVVVTPATASIAPGATQQFAAAATDGGGSAVSGVNFLWVSSDHGVATVDTAGLATGVGDGTVTVTAVGEGEPGNAVLTVTGLPASSATQVAFSSQPGSAVAGDAISPAIQVEIRDSSGALVTAARDAVTLAIGTNPGSGSLAGSVTANAVNGIASFSGIWIDKTGTGYTMSASSGTLTGATSSTFNISHAAPAKVAFATAPTGVEGLVTFNPTVQVSIFDRFDNVATTAADAVTVDLGDNPWSSVFATGGTLVGTLTVNASNGVASFADLFVDKPAAGYTLNASGGGLDEDESGAFDVGITIQSLAVGGAGAVTSDGHTCAVTTGGTYCWGLNGFGQLGFMTGNSFLDSVPGPVTGAQTFVAVTAGDSHSCGITATGAAYCWGYNGFGQLGDGNVGTNSQTPVAVSGGLTFASIAAGAFHTCGLVGSDVYCWGDNAQGQLGNGNSPTDSDVPVMASGGLTFTSMSVGGSVSCGIDNNGDGYCWGDNSTGSLGDANSPTDSDVPVAVSGGLTFTSITVGKFVGNTHVCGVVANGDAYCWGDNGRGQLGDSNSPNDSNIPVIVSGGLSWSTMSAGGFHTCGVTTGGTGYCWGLNGDGQLGDDNAPTDASTRVLIFGGLTFSSIESGYRTSCGLTTGGDAYCWGRNVSGQLGNGTRIQANVPVRVIQ